MPGRTLDQPPSDRYARSGDAAGRPDPATAESGGAPGPADARSPVAPELKAGVVAIIGAALLVVLGGVIGLTTGLLFVAGVTGAGIGLLLAGSSRSRAWVRNAAVATAAVVVLLGAVGSWLIGLAEGGSIGLLDFVWATTGLLVPVELLVAAAAAAWGASAGPIRG